MPATQFAAKNIQAKSLEIKSEFAQKEKELRVFRAVQTRIKQRSSVQESFMLLDTCGSSFNEEGRDVNLGDLMAAQKKSDGENFAKNTHGRGYLTLKDFQQNFSRCFDLALKAEEVRALFNEIDSDENGIIKYMEWEAFVKADYI